MSRGVERPLWDALEGAPLAEPVLATCGTVVTWGDVVDWMAHEGTWQDAARRAAEGAELAAAGADAPSADELRAAAQAFRRDRRLIAGEDLLRWLARWAVAEEEWVEWLERSLRRRAAGPPARPVRLADERATWVEAVCSGALEAAAADLSRALGAWAERSAGAQPPDGDHRADELRRALEALEGAEVPPGEIARTLSTHAAGWVQLSMEVADFGTPDAAREAVAAIRDDGMSIAGVSVLARVELRDLVCRAEELGARVRAAAVSAPIGTPVELGTPEAPGLVAVVRSRRHPSPDDTEDAALAARACSDQRVQVAVDRWVTWHV